MEKWFSIFELLYKTFTLRARYVYSIYWRTNRNKPKWYCGFTFENYLGIFLRLSTNNNQVEKPDETSFVTSLDYSSTSYK